MKDDENVTRILFYLKSHCITLTIETLERQFVVFIFFTIFTQIEFQSPL